MTKNMRRIVRYNLQNKSYRIRRYQLLSESTKTKRFQRAKLFLKRLKSGMNREIVWSGEEEFYVEQAYNHKSDCILTKDTNSIPVVQHPRGTTADARS